MHGKGGAAFEFAIIIGDPSEKAVNEWNRENSSVPERIAFSRFSRCKKLFRSTGLEQLAANPRICGVVAKTADYSIERARRMSRDILPSGISDIFIALRYANSFPRYLC